MPVTEEQIIDVLDNRADAAEAERVAAYMATDKGQEMLAGIIDRDPAPTLPAGEIPSERIYAAVNSAIAARRRRRIMLHAAAVVIPLLLVAGAAFWGGMRAAGVAPFGAPQMMVQSVANGDSRMVVFQDGTTVHLNSGSQLTYPSNFGPGGREVELCGEAYFEVAHNPRRPFTVQVRGCEVKVLGTSFNIRAYPENDCMTVSLDEGHVVWTAGGNSYDLHTSQMLTYDCSSGRTVISECDTRAQSLWRERIIAFRNAPIEEIAAELSHLFDVSFRLSERLDRNRRYTFTTPYITLESILEELEFISPLRFVRDGDEIRITNSR